jgi:uncharacterized membrane protein
VYSSGFSVLGNAQRLAYQVLGLNEMGSDKVRFDEIDGLRGFAIAQMVVYHLCYDLNHFGWTNFPIGLSLNWKIWQVSIISTFLLLTGISLVLRDSFKPSWRDFWRRWVQIVASALAVSLGSYLIFPESYIFFGILHFISLALVLGRLMLRFGAYNLIFGFLVIVLGLNLSHPLFNAVGTSWIGLVTKEPFTQDFVPIFPWFGVVLIGCGLGNVWRSQNFKKPKWIEQKSLSIPRLLTWMGKHSLAIYLIHQPILFILLFAISRK